MFIWITALVEVAINHFRKSYLHSVGESNPKEKNQWITSDLNMDQAISKDNELSMKRRNTI